MRRIALLVVLLLALLGCGKSPEQQIVGVWHYDPGQIQLDLSQQAQQELAKAGVAGQQMLAKMREQFAKGLSTFKITFKEDKGFLIADPQSGKSLAGKWAVEGRKVKVTMDKKDQPTPDMKLSEDGSRIDVSYTTSYGQAKMQLIRG